MEIEARFITAHVSKRDIAYVSHIIEGYEGMATVTTITPDEGLIRITVSPFFYEEVKALLAGLGKKVVLKLLDEKGQ